MSSSGKSRWRTGPFIVTNPDRRRFLQTIAWSASYGASFPIVASVKVRVQRPTSSEMASAGDSQVPTVAPSTRVPYVPPRFDTIPHFRFVAGTPGTFNVAPYFHEGNAGTAVLWSTPDSVDGVTFNAELRQFEFDGRILSEGATASTGSFTISADDRHDENVHAVAIAGAELGKRCKLVVREPSGTTGMAFRKGDIPSGSSVVADIGGFQALIKNRWQDGSAKIAVLSWNDASISYARPRTLVLRKGDGAATAAITLATLRSASPAVTVSLGSHGTVNLQRVIGNAPFRQWLAGPQCSEWHWFFPIGADPTLALWFYVRLYASGAIWIRVIVENGYTRISPQTSKVYRAVITINGATAYDSALESTRIAPAKRGDDLVHWSRTRWTKEFWYDARPLRAPVHDGAYLIDTRLFPHFGYRNQGPGAFNYDRTQYVSSAWFDSATGQHTAPELTVSPLTCANQRPDMSPGGYSPTIGIIPLWDALYLLSGREDIYFCSIANACAGGTFVAWRDENTKLPVKWSDRPNLWAQSGDSNSLAPALDPSGSGLRYNVAHSPSFAYSAYIFTGDFYHVETMQFAATMNWAVRSYSDREGVLGIYWAWIQARDFAWMIRTLVQTLCITPDGHPLAADYLASLNANVRRHLDVSVYGTHDTWGAAKNALGAICLNTSSGNSPPYGTGQYYYEAPWQQHFIGAVLSHAQDLDLASGAAADRLDRLMRFSLGHAVGMLGDDSGWPYTLGGTYVVPYLKNATTGKNAGYPPASSRWWAPDWATVYAWHREYKPAVPSQKPIAASAALFDPSSYVGGGDPGIENGYVNGPAFALSMWGNLMPAISAAVDKGVPGAAESWARLTSASNWLSNARHFNDRPVWGVTPR